MADTTPTVDPVTQGDSQTEVTNVPTPTAPEVLQDNGNAAEVERLRQEKEKAELRIRQLENEKAAREKVEEEAKRKQLEEQEEWKQIAEQEKAKREALESERTEAERTQNLKFAEDTIFAEFSQEAIEVARDAGLSLKDDSEESKNDFKQRMEKISAKVASNVGVTPNNPGGSTQPVDRSEQVQRMRNGDRQARDEVIGSLDVLERMRAQAGYTKQ